MRRGRVAWAALAAGLAALLAACTSGGTAATSRAAGDGQSGTTVAGRSAGAEDWPSHGLDLANNRTTRNERAITPDNVAGLTQAWATPNLRGMSANPLYLDGVLYFGDWTGHVRALDATTGTEKWATDLQTYYIGGSVAADGERVFVPVFDGKVTALDRKTGAQVWSTPVDDGPGSAVFASPVVVDGLVIVGVASFDEFANPHGSQFRGHVSALDTATGKEVWRFWTTNNDATSGPGIAVWSAVSVDEQRHLVFVPTGNNYLPPSGPLSDAVVAIDARTGKQVWVARFTTADVWTLGGETGPDADVGAPPNLFDVKGRPAIGVGDKAGVFHAVDRETGRELWTRPLTQGGPQGGVMASGAYDSGKVYIASNKGAGTADLVALAVDDGSELWRVDVGGHMTGPVTLSNGVLYMGDDRGEISAFAAADGKKLWSATVPAAAAAGITIADGTVYAGFGWWLARPPQDPQGGLIAYRLPAGGQGGSSAAGTTRALPLGEATYIRSCSSCHGGDGGGGFGPSLKGVESRLSLDEHLNVVRNGRNKMPAWAQSLSEEEIRAVVEYERATFR